jgi:hypothetical protein
MGTGARKTFGRLLIDICYLEYELCDSDNLEDSRGADEESELSSIPTHTTLGRWHCQPQAPLKKPADCLVVVLDSQRKYRRLTPTFSRLFLFGFSLF